MKLFWKAKVMKNTLIRLIFGEGDGNFRAAFFVVLQKKFSFCLYFFFVTVSGKGAFHVIRYVSCH